MCGLIAIFSPRGSTDVAALRRGMAALRHRGPDSEAYWRSDDGRLGLAHTRLSIVALDHGAQPIANRSGTVHIVVNGEFYGHERIRADLELRGHRFATGSDSEIALHLYEEYGTRFVEHLRGEFAIVVWDERTKTLLSVRDRFGIKPLYYGWQREQLFIASEAKALFAAGFAAAWDHEAAYQKMAWGLDNGRSMFRDILQVPPGHMLLASEGSTRLIPYWDQDYPLEDQLPAPRPEAEMVHEVRGAMYDATRLRLRADVPVGCYLSGGLDSCALLGMMADIRQAPVDVFTVSFEEEAYDEGPIASEMAERAGANFHCFEFGHDARADGFADAVWHGEVPHIGGNSVAKFLLSERVRDAGYKVVMTGEGSDEIFGGYPSFRQDMVRHHGTGGDDPSDAFARLRAKGRVAQAFLASDPALVVPAAQATLGFTPAWMQAWADKEVVVRPLLDDATAERFRDYDCARTFLNSVDMGKVVGRQRVSTSLYLWSKSVLPDILLNILGDRMEMAHSIEGRTPFLDHHVVEMVNALPIEMKIRGMTEKYVLREAMRPYVTDTVYKRTKHPFMAPEGFTGRFGTMVHDTLHSSALDSLPFFDTARVRDALRAEPDVRDPAMRGRLVMVLTMITSLCILQKRYGL